jgi:MFS family permease
MRRFGQADDRYRWLLVGALSITVTVSYGVLTYAFGVLLPAMRHDLGWSRTQITGAFSLALLVSALAGLLVGPLLDRRSPRLLMTGGALAAALLVVGWSRVQTLAELYLVFVGLGATMATLLYEPVFIVITKWFGSSLRAALTAVTIVGASASLIFSPLTERLESALGWRAALLVLAAILGATALPVHALVLRPSPPVEQTARGTPRQVFGDTPFWLFAAALTVATFASYAIVVHLVSLLIQSGRTAAFAAFVAGLLGIGQLPGRLAFGFVAKRFGAVALPAVVFGLGASSLALLAVAREPWTAIVFALGYGASNGMATLLRATLVADLWGRGSYGAISAAIAAPFNAARAAAPVSASFLVLLPGHYTTLLWVLSAGTGIAALVGVIAVRRARELIATDTRSVSVRAAGRE